MKEKKYGAMIGAFLGLMLIFTIVSRARDTIRTPQVKTAALQTQVIRFAMEKRGIAEKSEEGLLCARLRLEEGEEKYLDANAEILVGNAAGNAVTEESGRKVGREEASGAWELTVFFPEAGFEAEDLVTVQVFYTSQPYSCCVPKGAVHTDARGNSYVYVTEEQDVILGERIVARPVTVKVIEMDEKYAALEKGSLGQEQQVIYEADREFGEGDRVRVVEEK